MVHEIWLYILLMSSREFFILQYMVADIILRLIQVQLLLEVRRGVRAL
jgi:hypothetical protein